MLPTPRPYCAIGLLLMGAPLFGERPLLWQAMIVITYCSNSFLVSHDGHNVLRQRVVEFRQHVVVSANQITTFLTRDTSKTEISQRVGKFHNVLWKYHGLEIHGFDWLIPQRVAEIPQRVAAIRYDYHGVTYTSIQPVISINWSIE